MAPPPPPRRLEELDLTPRRRMSVEDLCDCCFPKPPMYTPVWSHRKRPFPEFHNDSVGEVDDRPVHEIDIDPPQHSNNHDEEQADPEQDDDDLLLYLGTGEIDGTSLPELYASEEEEDASEGILSPKNGPHYTTNDNDHHPKKNHHQHHKAFQIHQVYFLGFFQVLMSLVLFRRWSQDCHCHNQHCKCDQTKLIAADTPCTGTGSNNPHDEKRNVATL
ncbi:expressed unknown protein [Seminavis robusta]|uniref:Uncharacterized protein n=1 Tax=Seminavis robusta TaxID=568900 RepID=A0A9N8H697_9STRA|nr:expressed unknown protein [Seminavis robusta]|eukprot:Sro93_g048720.1 n/a (218) ;mRNA; r:113718-114502